ncbi:MAG: nuclear transport factor 2 family protein [bacterium]
MKRRRALAASALPFLAGFLITVTCCQKLEKKKLISTLETRTQALQTGNHKKYLELFAPDYNDTRFELDRARQKIKQELTRKPHPKIEIKQRKIEMEGNRAVATERFSLRTTVKGQARSYNDTQHLLLEKRADEWVCLSGSEVLWIIAGKARKEHQVEQVLLRRENALMNEDIKTYSRLISSRYNHQEKDKQELREQIVHTFQVYDEIKFKSFDRRIYFYGDYATVNQKFNMHALQMGESKTWSGQERLTLQESSQGWKFIKGL